LARDAVGRRAERRDFGLTGIPAVECRIATVIPAELLSKGVEGVAALFP
jgi:hypothetical protein